MYDSGEAIQYEVTAQIFLSIIRGARRHHEFSSIPFDEQNTILHKSWAALFLLRSTSWPYVFDNYQNSLTNEKNGLFYLKTSRDAITTLALDEIEFVALETILLCRKGMQFSELIIIFKQMN